jgi:hypothetical protein
VQVRRAQRVRHGDRVAHDALADERERRLEPLALGGRHVQIE